MADLAGSYFFSGAATGAVGVGADIGAVGVIDDCSAGFGASCCLHPAKTKNAATARTAMSADIFFIFFTPFLLIGVSAVRLPQ